MASGAARARPGREGAPQGRRLFPYLVILPGLAFYLLFTVYPVADQTAISFLHWNVVPGVVSPFVGLANYAAAFQDPVFLTAIRNTILYIAVTVPAQMVLGLAAAHLLMSRVPARGLWRTLIFLPVVISWVVVIYLFSYLFATSGGLVNAALTSILGPNAAIPWLQSTWPAMGVIWLLAVWKGMGWSMVIFLAALSTVPEQLLEAARVDGARAFRVWWHVRLPAIRAATTFIFVMLLIGATQAFTSVFLMTAGGPDNTTQVILTYGYQQAFQFFNFGYAAAMATMVGVVLLGLSIVVLRVMRERG